MTNQSTMTRLRRSTRLAFAAFFPISWLLAGSTALAIPMVDPVLVGPKTITVGDNAEAWYLSVPLPVDLCATPLGCPQVPLTLPSVYAPDTLHVGVVLGTEIARTYLRPELVTVPAGSHVLMATMTLPIDTAAQDATLSPESADVVACLATESFEDGADGGLFKAIPKVDCKTSARLAYDAMHQVFTVDITKFVDAWANGSPENGIALVPDATKTTVTDLWHVTLIGHRHAGAHIKTSVTYTPPSTSPPVDNGVTDTPPPAAVDDVTPPAVLPDEGVVPPAEPAPVLAPAAQPVAFVKHFKYPMAFLFPIALLALGVFMMRLFTSDATPVRQR